MYLGRYKMIKRQVVVEKDGSIKFDVMYVFDGNMPILSKRDFVSAFYSLYSDFTVSEYTIYKNVFDRHTDLENQEMTFISKYEDDSTIYSKFVMCKKKDFEKAIRNLEQDNWYLE